MAIPVSTMDEAMTMAGAERQHNNIRTEVRAPIKLDAGRLRKAVFKARQDHPLARAGNDAGAIACREQLLNLRPPLQESPTFYIWLLC